MPKTIDLVWIAGSDLIAHARRGREPQTLCGRLPLPERYAWPGETRCPVCVAKSEPVHESELRAMDGDR